MQKNQFINAGRLSPSMWKAYLYAGITARLTGSMREAAYYLGLARNRNPQDPDIHYYLAEVYYDMYDLANTRYEISQAFAMNLSSDKRQALEKIQTELNDIEK